MRKLLFTLVLCFVASELAAAAEPAVHKMNLSESKPFALDSSRLLSLENSDLARIGEVKNMLTKDGRYIILTGNDIKAFSTSDGHFLEGYSYPSFQRDAEGKRWFIFQTTDRDWHLARIDEATGRTDIYDPKIEGYKMMPFLDIADRKARMLFRKVDKDETAGIFGATSGPVAVALIDLNVLTD